MGFGLNAVMSMDSWNYGTQGNDFMFPEDMDLPIDVLSRGKAVRWETKYPITDDGFNDMIRETLPGTLSVGSLSGEVGSDSSRGVNSSTRGVADPYSHWLEEENGSMLSSCVMESNSQDSSLINLELGRFSGCTDAKKSVSLKEGSAVSSVDSSVPAKRARTTSSCSQSAFCQVHGCNMNLGTSKDYYKKHRVCTVHSKTPKVIVNGIEQRFCQQCSRFHLLSEFDDSKRSCRRRLAGHNERRRKPQSQNWMKSYQGAGGILCTERYTRSKFDEWQGYSHGMLPNSNAPLFLQSSLQLPGLEKHYIPGMPSSEHYDYAVLNTTCALSLLSAQSHDIASHSAEIAVSDTFTKDNDFRFDDHRNPFKLKDISSLQKCTSRGFYRSGLPIVEVDQVEPSLISDCSSILDFEANAAGASRGSAGFQNAKCNLSPERGSTVNLLQLSSHFQRVEQQRNSLLVKQEIDDPCLA